MPTTVVGGIVTVVSAVAGSKCRNTRYNAMFEGSSSERIDLTHTAVSGIVRRRKQGVSPEERGGVLVPAVAVDSWTSIFAASRVTRPPLAMAAAMVGEGWNFRYLKFPFYGLAALQIQYAWRNYRQNAIYDMSTSKEIASAGRFSSLQESNSRQVQETDELCSIRRGEDKEEEGEQASAVSLETRAAKAIQDCWRSRVSKSIYRYYRQGSSKNIIDFRLGGDPRLLLRAINPGEAALFDRAAGVHLRFRLGGYTFPPSIYYKVYTHQPVADICAFAPRAYSEDVKATPAERWNHQSEHSKAGKIRVGSSYFGTAVKRTGPKGTENWYRRHENNGWRPITIKTLTSAEDDPVTIATAKAPASRSGDSGDGSGQGRFHYSKLVREECRAARIKRRKRRWLMTMYSAGLAEAAASSSDTGAAASGARSSSPSHTTSHSPHRHHQRDDSYYHQGRGDGGGGGAPGWEQGDYRGAEGDRGWLHQQWSEDAHSDDGALLVRWSEGLDFDRYLSEWRQMATSGPSEPWRNADDFADYVARKGEGKTVSGGGGGAPFGNSAAATATKVGGRGNTLPRGGKAAAGAATAAIAAAARPSTPPTGFSCFSPARGGDRRRGSPGFDGGGRKGGVLHDDGRGIGDGHPVGRDGDANGPLHGGNGGGGNGDGGGTMFDSIVVDLGSV
eukprot:g17323.t1